MFTQKTLQDIFDKHLPEIVGYDDIKACSAIIQDILNLYSDELEKINTFSSKPLGGPY